MYRLEQKSRAVVDEYGQIEALLNAESKEGEEEEEDGEKKDDEDAENEEEYEDEEELVDDNDYAENYFDNGEGDDDDDGDNEDAYSWMQWIKKPCVYFNESSTVVLILLCNLPWITSLLGHISFVGQHLDLFQVPAFIANLWAVMNVYPWVAMANTREEKLF